MHPKAMFETDKYRSRGCPGVGGTKTGGERRHSLIFSKARWQSSFQIVSWFFLRRRKIGSHMFVNLAMKRLIYCSFPRKPLISLSILGAGLSSMTDIFRINLYTTLIDDVSEQFPKSHPKGTSWDSILTLTVRSSQRISVVLLSDLPCIGTSLSCHPHIPRRLCASCRGIK